MDVVAESSPVVMSPEPLVLPAEAASARSARRWAAHQVVQMGRQDLVDVVELLVSEVVTNSILHAGTTVRVMIRPFLRRGIRVDVWDGSRVRPRHPFGYGPEATTGRGTQLLAQLASSWGSVPAADGGKVTWFLVEPEATR